MSEHPAALQLRLSQTVVEVAAEKNSTLVLPFPVELLRFLERSTPAENPKPTASADPTTTASPAARSGSRVPAAADLQKVRELEQTGGPVSPGRSKLPSGLTATAQLLADASVTTPDETAGSAQTDWGGLPVGSADPAWQP